MNSTITIFLILFSQITFAAEKSYICTGDKSVGFEFDAGLREWDAANFGTRDEKFIISKSDRYPWVVKRIGQDSIRIKCKKDFNEYGYLICAGGITEIRFSKDKLRYLITYNLGYWSHDLDDREDGFKEGDNTPFMEIGKCTSF